MYIWQLTQDNTFLFVLLPIINNRNYTSTSCMIEQRRKEASPKVTTIKEKGWMAWSHNKSVLTAGILKFD